MGDGQSAHRYCEQVRHVELARYQGRFVPSPCLLYALDFRVFTRQEIEIETMYGARLAVL